LEDFEEIREELNKFKYLISVISSASSSVKQKPSQSDDLNDDNSIRDFSVSENNKTKDKDISIKYDKKQQQLSGERNLLSRQSKRVMSHKAAVFVPQKKIKHHPHIVDLPTNEKEQQKDLTTDEKEQQKDLPTDEKEQPKEKHSFMENNLPLLTSIEIPSVKDDLSLLSLPPPPPPPPPPLPLPPFPPPPPLRLLQSSYLQIPTPIIVNQQQNIMFYLSFLIYFIYFFLFVI
jgi:hypothetical protein